MAFGGGGERGRERESVAGGSASFASSSFNTTTTTSSASLRPPAACPGGRAGPQAGGAQAGPRDCRLGTPPAPPGRRRCPGAGALHGEPAGRREPAPAWPGGWGVGGGASFLWGHGLGPWPGAWGSQPPGPGPGGQEPGRMGCLRMGWGGTRRRARSPLAYLEGPVGGAVGLGPARAGETQGGGAPGGPAPAPALLHRPRQRRQRPLELLHAGVPSAEGRCEQQHCHSVSNDHNDCSGGSALP